MTPLLDVAAVGARLLDHPGAAFFLWPKRGVCDVKHPLIQTAYRFRSERGAHLNDLQVQPGSAVVLPFASLPLGSIMCHVGKPRGRGSITYNTARADERPMIDSSCSTIRMTARSPSRRSRRRGRSHRPRR